MAFLSSQSIMNIQNSPRPLISEFDPNRLKSGTYWLSLGNEIYQTDDSNCKINYNDNEQICINPGQFTFMITKEKVCIPENILGFISLKTRTKFKGLINVSGFHVDPGFNGRLKYSVYNAGSKCIHLTIGEPLFPIWFCKFDQDTGSYKGSNSEPNCITNEDVDNIHGYIPSPHYLEKKLKKLISLGKTILALLIPLVIALIIVIVNFFSSKNNSSLPYNENNIILNSKRIDTTENNSYEKEKK